MERSSSHTEKSINLALFDFDGTITVRETFRDFLEFAVPRHRLVLGQAALSPMVVGYKLGLVSGRLMRAAAVRIALANMEVEYAAALGKKFATEVLPTLLRPDVMKRIEWHKAAGDRVIVVSGALELFLKPWCERYGLEVIASKLEARGGRLTGRYAGHQCVAVEKPARVRAILNPDSYRLIHAYGDTTEDFELLRMAHERTFRGRPWVDPLHNQTAVAESVQKPEPK